MSRTKTSAKLTEATKGKSDAGRAGHRPAVNLGASAAANGMRPPPGSRAAAQEECDRANVPIINATDFEAAQKAGAFTPENIRRSVAGEPLILKTDPRTEPWEGKKRLDAGEKMLRCVLTADEIEERKNELLSMHKQVQPLRQAVADAKEALATAKTALSAHESKIEMHAMETDRGWVNRNVECITVLETRRGMPVRVCYRTDTGEEAIPPKEASAADVQESIPGA